MNCQFKNYMNASLVVLPGDNLSQLEQYAVESSTLYWGGLQ